ncbi:hypothetical protein CFP56_029376 [Quercus suber]|uniref:Uncharacterized protein n=1 Tax=Quercus suber TaxID=58331 RepID=A0AAW0LU36_QUESU
MEYAEVAKLEEEFWALKARILWLVEGDRNTSFYYTSALVCRRFNHILCMKDRCCHQSIPVRAVLSKRGMDIPFLCPMCNDALGFVLY